MKGTISDHVMYIVSCLINTYLHVIFYIIYIRKLGNYNNHRSSETIINRVNMKPHKSANMCTIRIQDVYLRRSLTRQTLIFRRIPKSSRLPTPP